MRVTAAWAPERAHAPALTVNRPSKPSAAKSPATGKSSLEVRSHTNTGYSLTHTRTHARTHARAHTRTHTHTHRAQGK